MSDSKPSKTFAEKLKTPVHLLLMAGAMAGSAALTGCGGAPGSVPTAVHGAALHGSVFGGQQPVQMATIQLYAAATSVGGPYAAASMPLITTTTVTTDANGGFNITNDYMCPSATTQVYLTATGGNTGGFGTNSNIAVMAALGDCGNLGMATFISVNEVTTIASVYALSPFMSGPTHVGAPTSNAAGLRAAFADVNVLTDTTAGTTPGPMAPTGATVPVNEINTLANIIATCINSGGGTAGSQTSCGTLFTNTTVNGVAPIDTVTAALNIAQHPAANVTALYNMPPPPSPFQPGLMAQPNDFTLAVNFPGALSAPSGLAADAAGNIWIANATGNTVTELNNLGASLSGTGFTANLNAPSAIAIDATGTVWVTNKGNSSISKLTSSGAQVSGSPFSGGGLNLPASIAFDSNNTAWIANAGAASVTSVQGTTFTGYTPAGANANFGIAVNPH